MIIKTNDYKPTFLSETEGNGVTIFNDLVKLDRGNLICIAAHPGMGKTSLALHMALEFAKKSDKTVYIFSHEMSAEQIYSRMLCYLAEVDLYSMRQKEFFHRELVRLSAASERLQKLNIIINDETFLAVTQIEEKMQDIDNLGLVVVIDYVQLIKPDVLREKRAEEIGDISHFLKILTRKKNIPIVIISQLHRGIERRIDKRPKLSDIALVGGSTEVDSDTVIFIYRDGYYNLDDGTEDCTEAEICIAKNRFGSVGTLRYKWQGRYGKFGEVNKEG